MPPFPRTRLAYRLSAPHGEGPHLGQIGLLQFQLVELHLVVVLPAQVFQGLGNLRLVLLLAAAVHPHQVALLPFLSLPHFLRGGSGWVSTMGLRGSS